MRLAFSLTILHAATLLAQAQPPGVELPPRFEVRAKPKTYPQANPKQALSSLVAAVDAGDHNYVVAHILDPEFVDGRIALRAKQLKETVEGDLKKLREVQRPNIGNIPKESRVPEDPREFEAFAAEQARVRAFPSLVADAKEKVADDPQVMKDLRRFVREGTFDDAAGATSRATLPDLKDRAVYFKKVGDRWFIENRQTDAAPAKDPDPKKPADEKKP